MRFSLVLSTLKREDEVERFFRFLVSQSYAEVEVIVVDQNEDDRLRRILKHYRSLVPIVCIKSQAGLSRSRNLGLRRLSGDVVGFPDDDCWYPPRLLATVAQFFSSHHQWHGIAGRAIDGRGVPLPRWAKTAGVVTKFNVWRRAISYTVFLRRTVIEAIGDFDESLGVGAPWGSGEETDYLLRALEQGLRIYYDPKISIHHPAPATSVGMNNLKRGYSYGLGMGRVLRKHRYPAWFVLYPMLLPVVRSVSSRLRGRLEESTYHWNVLQGRLQGWRSSTPQ